MLIDTNLSQNQLNQPRLSLESSQTPTVGPLEFKDAMASLAFSIAIVTASHSNEQTGRTVTSFMPLSVEPPLIVISIDARSRLVDLIVAGRSFSLSFLSPGQETVGDGFAGRWPQAVRFSLSDWTYWPSGNPRLAGARLCMDCEMVSSIDAGDHILFVGALIEIDALDEGELLIWNQRAYSVLRR